MSAMSGFVSGVIALTLLEATVSSDVATNNATGIFVGAANLVRRLASPDVPMIPDLAGSTGSASYSSLTGTAPKAGTSPTAAVATPQPATRLPVSASA